MNGSGPLESSVTLEDVFAVVSARRVPLAPELAGYLVLEVTDNADPTGGEVDPKSVYVGEEGTVALVKPKREAATGDAEASIRGALARLLEASGSQTPALAAASRRRSGAGLPALAEELEAALIPVNRAAGRRALARLAREVKRVTLGVGRNALPSSSDAPSSRRGASADLPVATARSPERVFPAEEEPTTARGQIPPELLKKATPPHGEASELPTLQFEPRGPTPSESDVDSLIDRFSVPESVQVHARELKVIAGIEPTPPVPAISPGNIRVEPPEAAAPEGSDVDALLGLEGREAKALDPVKPAARSSPRASRASVPDERQLPTQPSEIRRRASAASLPQVKRGRGPGFGVVIALGLVGAGAYAVWRLAPSIVGGHAQEQPPATNTMPSAAPATVCKRTIIVSEVPPHAEVLLREGQAPVDVRHLPVGIHLEFVATAEGFAPKRLIVAENASWDNGADGVPRLETAVQLDKSKARPGGVDLWPPPDPGSGGHGRGQPGTVRVVATPRGAEVWMLVGGSPEAQIIEDSCEQEAEVLVAGPTTLRKRLHAAASDFTSADPPGAAPARIPSRIAHISAK
jgi:hypothetical protein